MDSSSQSSNKSLSDSDSRNDNDCQESINKKIKDNNQQPISRISRKMSDDLIRCFERLPDEEINKLINYVKSQNSPDLPVNVNVDKLLRDEFQLNSDSEPDKESKRKKRESKEKECKCCKQVVKRHQCQHTECQKPCPIQDKKKKPA